MIKTCRTLKYFKTQVAGCLFLAVVPIAQGAGVAAYKEQPFHADSSATPIVYFKILESTPIAINFDLGARQTAFVRTKIVANVDIPEMPPTIRNESELEPLNKSFNEIKAFATRFPQCASLLQPYIESFGKAIVRFHEGEVRYAGAWISKEGYAAILKRQHEETEMKRRQIEEGIEQMRIQEQKEAEFAKSQREKGLEKYRDDWLPREQALELQKRDEEESIAWEKVRAKSILAATYSIFQVLDDGVLIRPHKGQLENKGINVDIAYLTGVVEAAAAEGDYYKGDLYWYGNYSYRNKAGDDRTVNAYCLNKDDAVQNVKNMLFGEERPKDERTVIASQNTNSLPDVPSPLKSAKSTGSGFFVGNEGYFVTNAHVVDDSTDVFVYYGGKMIRAEVVKVSKVADLAILKVAQKVVGIEISDDEPQPGDDVFAIGYPQPTIQGLEAKITKGVISSSKGLEDDDTRFQIDAAIQPGNSGGPLCDSVGRLIGVAVSGLNQIAIAKATGTIPQNVNYGIKANEVSAILRTKSIQTDVPSDIGGPAASRGSAIKMASDKTALVIVK